MHFIRDVTLFNEQNLDKLFIDEAKSKPELLKKTSRVVRNGIIKFMDYMIELKQNNPALLDNLLSDYEISSSIHPAEHISDKHLVSCISLEAH